MDATYRLLVVLLTVLLTVPTNVLARTVDHLFVDTYCNWNENKRQGTATYSAPAGSVIVNVKFDSGKWGVSGYSSHLAREASSIHIEEHMKAELRELHDAHAKANNDEVKARYEREIKNLGKKLTDIKASHDTIVVSWTCESDGKFYDQKRGVRFVVVEYVGVREDLCIREN